MVCAKQPDGTPCCITNPEIQHVYEFILLVIKCLSKQTSQDHSFCFFNLQVKEVNDTHLEVSLCLHQIAKDSGEATKTWRSKWDKTLKMGILRWPLIWAIWEAY